MAVALATLFAVHAATASEPSAGALSPSHRTTRWAGGPLGSVSSEVIGTGCTPTSCDQFALDLRVPASWWAAHQGGVLVRIAWDDPTNELDLRVLDASGTEVVRSAQYRTTFEQVFIPNPKPGRYTVVVEVFRSIVQGYRGTAAVYPWDPPDARLKAGSMRFAAPTIVDPQTFATEPSIWIDKRDVYVTALTNYQAPGVWRSGDGGRTFTQLQARIGGMKDPRRQPCSAEQGGSDEDIVTDRTGRVYLADLITGVSASYSEDRGSTWSCTPIASNAIPDDRPWIAPAPRADGAGPNVDAYLAYRNGETAPFAGSKQFVDVTRDGGQTWHAVGTFGENLINFDGPIFTAADGTLYEVFDGHGSIWVARSTDEGRSFKVFRISSRLQAPATKWVSGDVDRAGNVYATWTDGGTFDVMFSMSRDRGAHWTTPRRLNPPASETAVMAWLAAGDAGDVAVAWLGTGSAMTQPDTAAPDAPWHLWVARTQDGTTFEIGRMTPEPVHYGPVNRSTGGASTDHLGDFFEIDIAPDGAVVAAISDNGRDPSKIAGEAPHPFVVVVRQVSGLGMSGKAADVSEPVGEAREAAPLDLASLGTALRTGRSLTVSFRLGSARDLAAAVGADPTSGTDAYWIATWKAKGKLGYVGMHLDATGGIEYFGGDNPTNDVQTNTFTQFHAAYPPRVAITGHVDPRSRAVTLTAPLDLFGLTRGATLRGLQVFTMRGTALSQNAYDPFDVVDVTPARDVVLN